MSMDQGRTLNKLSANNHIQPSRRIELVQVITEWQQHSYTNLPAFIYLCLTLVPLTDFEQQFACLLC